MFPFPDLCFLPLFCLRPATAVVRVRLQKSDIRFVSLTCDWSRQTLTAGEAVLESGWMQTRRKLLLTVSFGNGKIGIAQNNFILKEMEFRTTDETIKLSNCLKLWYWSHVQPCMNRYAGECFVSLLRLLRDRVLSYIQCRLHCSINPILHSKWSV